MRMPLFTFILVIASVLLVSQLYLSFISPNGVWIRRELRENPLKNPLLVSHIDGLTLVADNQTYTLGGLSPPVERSQIDAITEFLFAAVAQGIEIDNSEHLPKGQYIRCEPRIRHWCGTDPIAAHFQQMNLNEIVVALGYAQLAPEVAYSNTHTALRLRAAAYHANMHQTAKRQQTDFKHGLDVSKVMSVSSQISSVAYQMQQGDL